MNIKRVITAAIVAVLFAVAAALVIRVTIELWWASWAAWAGSAASVVLISLAFGAFNRAWLVLRYRGYARPAVEFPLFARRVRSLTHTVQALWTDPQSDERATHPINRFEQDAWLVRFDDGSFEEVERPELYFWLVQCWQRQDKGKNAFAQRYWEPRIGRRQLDARLSLLVRSGVLSNFGPRRPARLRATPWPTYEAVEKLTEVN